MKYLFPNSENISLHKVIKKREQFKSDVIKLVRGISRNSSQPKYEYRQNEEALINFINEECIK